MLLFCLAGCKNESNLDLSKEIVLSIKLPSLGRSVTYHTQDDITSFKVSLLKLKKENGITVDEEITSVTGNPGETVKLSTNEAGDYKVKVCGLADNDNIVAEGISYISLNYENLKPSIKVTIKPTAKNYEFDFIVLSIDYEYEDEDLVPDTQVNIQGNDTIHNFLITNTAITYLKWYTVCEWAKENGYVFANAGSESEDGESGKEPNGSTLYVSNISYRDIIAWCNAASEMYNLVPVYYEKDTTDFTDTSKIIKQSESSEVEDGLADTCIMNPNANGFRLPSVQEWEYVMNNSDIFYFIPEWSNDRNEDSENDEENGVYCYMCPFELRLNARELQIMPLKPGTCEEVTFRVVQNVEE